MSNNKKVIKLKSVVIRFSGDSGDGMQLTGSLFSDTTALLGNDFATFPDYPSEIRAPQGTVGGVSGFQISFGSTEVNTPGDCADVLVAMNPAALKANLQWVKPAGTIIVDKDAFSEKNLKKAGYDKNPLCSAKLKEYHKIEANITSMTKERLKNTGLDNKTIIRSKNMFALGICYWLFNRPLKFTEKYIEEKFAKKKEILEANKAVLRAGYNFANTLEATTRTYQVNHAKIKKGTYRNISGNIATAWGVIAASKKSGRELFLGSYPITPATEILQELSLRKDLGVKSFQAEDEIAGIVSAIGASFAGNLAVTSTSGPGLALKTEAMGLAIITELPLVIVNVQRGGPSTGLPTKTEQSDLTQALYGRNGEAPLIVIAASTPSDCFHYAYIAAKLAMEHMTPVILLTDGFLANGSEPWKIPLPSELEKITPPIVGENDKNWKPYKRDKDKLSREWAVPGSKNLIHRVGGLEKDELTGNVSHNPENHEKMTKIRAEKVKRVENYIPKLKVKGDKDADLLVIGWGSTYGHIYSAIKELRKEKNLKIAQAHFNYINPLPKNTKEILSKYKKILVCELNMGQFKDYLTMNFPEFNYEKLNKIQGQPFTQEEIKDKILEII